MGQFSVFSTLFLVLLAAASVINADGSQSHYSRDVKSACQLYGHSCMGGHGKRSSLPVTPNGQDGGMDSDSAVNEAAVAAFQATASANRLNNELKELIARRIMASAGARIGDDGTDLMDKKTFGYLGVRK